MYLENLFMYILKLNKYELPYFSVYIYVVGVMISYATETATFAVLCYLGPLLYLYSIIKYKVLLYRNRNIPWYYWLLIIQLLFMWLRFDINGANGGTFRDINGAGATFLFLTLMWRPQIIRLKYLQKWIIIMMITGVVYTVLNWNELVAASTYIYNQGYYGDSSKTIVNMAMSVGYAMMSCGFLLCIQHLLTPKVRRLTLISSFLGLVVLMVSGRRGYSVLMICFILVYMMNSILYAPKNKRFYQILFIISLILISVLYFIENADTQFSVLVNRIEADSRTEVFYWWNKEMGDDVFKWVFGKGVSGGYYDGGFGVVRPGIENGIRHMILKGGLLYLIPYVILGLQAIFLGFFKSNSRTLKALAIYVAICIGFLYVWGTPSFSFLHLSMWISFVLIFDPKVRKMSDGDILMKFYQ